MDHVRPLMLVGLAALCWKGCALHAQDVWRRTYGGLGVESANSVRQTSDGGYIVAGTAGSFGHGASDVYLLRLDGAGDVIWSRTYGGPGVEQGVSCRELDDGFIVAATASDGQHGGYDLMLVRTDLDGEPVWQQYIGTPDWDICKGMEVTDDAILLVGTSYGAGSPTGQLYLVKTDHDGRVLWSVTPSDQRASGGNALVAMGDGGYVVAGSIVRAVEDTAGYVVAFNADGVEQWTIIAGTDTAQTFNGATRGGNGVVLIGTGRRPTNDVTWITLLGMDEAGSPVWVNHIGNDADSRGTAIAGSHADGYVITGSNSLNQGWPDMIFTRTDAEGWFLEGDNYGNGDPAMGAAIERTSDGGYVLVGWMEGTGPGMRSCYVVKTDSSGRTADVPSAPYLDPLPVEELVSPQDGTRPWSRGSSIVLGDAWSGVVRYELIGLDGRLVLKGVCRDGAVSTGGLSEGIYVLGLIRTDGHMLRQRMYITGR
ncbi:MAG: hypothetical protein KF797_07070 [Flavobacteriales bacterium]|nr:hypothetical protein [Flavobacteriales bacterium]